MGNAVLQLCSSEKWHCVLRNPKVHYHAHNSPLFIAVMSWSHPVHALPTNFFEIHFTIFSHLQPGLSSGLSPPGFPMKTVYAPLLCPKCTTSPNHLTCLDMTISIIPSEEENHEVPPYSLSSTLLLPCPSQAQILFSAPYSQTPSAYVLPSV